MDTIKKLPSRVRERVPRMSGKMPQDIPRQVKSNMKHSREINVGKTERLVSLLTGGTLLAAGTRRGGLTGGLLALAGASLVGRAASGYCMLNAALGRDTAGPRALNASVDGTYAMRVDRAITIDRLPAEVYEAWHDFEAFPCFMEHVESVTRLDDRRSHWVARAPLGQTVEWDAEIINDEPGRVIAWRSLAGADIDHAGSVRFAEAPMGRGTEVRVTLEYHAPAGVVGQTLAKLFGEEPGQQITEDLRRFKQMMEAGELARIEGRPSGRMLP